MENINRKDYLSPSVITNLWVVTTEFQNVLTALYKRSQYHSSAHVYATNKHVTEKTQYIPLF